MGEGGLNLGYFEKVKVIRDCIVLLCVLRMHNHSFICHFLDKNNDLANNTIYNDS